MKRIHLFTVLIAMATLASSFNERPPVSKKKPVVSAKKSLAFPVAGKKSNIGSFWGADRDGGRRRHEGIDIFAKKGTPVVAIADGYISDRGTYPLGGKVLWLKTSDYGWSAYYAHLDKWMVKEGQYVKKGQVLGTVGNTGNARTTPAHLHFGIYTGRGAVNPLPYVKNAPKVLLKNTPVKKKAVAKKSGAKKKAVAKKSSKGKRTARR